MNLHLTVDLDICQGHGLCYFESEELFDLRPEDGKAVILQDPVPAHLHDVARGCVDVCPERAIVINETA